MKRTLLALAIFALFLPAARNAAAADVSVDFFYNNLGGGSWIEVGDYGYGWQPEVAVSNRDWRPYADGYWAYTDVGWTWVSYEDFGWATYHYGRWARIADYGWVWFPGSDLEWGPAWVSWRTGGDYVGWAPLPPRGVGIVYEGRPIGGQVDIEFDIGPAYYNFVDVRYIGEPVLRDRIFAPSQNVTYINQTVNVTNITYNNNTVYNYGPDYNALSAQSSRPIQRLSLERQQNVDPTAAVKSGSITKVQGDKLVVAAPTKIQKSAKQMAPPTVKAKVAQPKLEHGWSGVANEAQLKQKMKTENPKNIPPSTRATAAGTAAAQASPGTPASPTASAAAATAASPVGKGKHKGKAAEQFQAGATASPAGALTSPTAAPAFPEKGKHKGKAGQQVQPGAASSPMASPGAATSPSIAPEYGKPGKGRRGEQLGGTSPTTAPTVGAEGITKPEGKHKGFERQNFGQTPSGAGSPGENFNQPRGKHKQFEQQQPATSPAGATSPGENFNQPGGKHNKRVEQQGMSPSGQERGAPGAQGGPYGEGRGKQKAEGVNAPPSGAAQAPAGQLGEKKHEEKGKGKGAGTPTPAPQ